MRTRTSPRPRSSPDLVLSHQRRLLLLLPSTSYRAAAFVEAATRLACDLTVASDYHNVFESAQPERFLALDFADPVKAAEQAKAFHAAHPIAGLFAVDDDTVVLAAHIARALGLPYLSLDAARSARDKHLQRTKLKAAGVPVPRFALHEFTDDLDAVAARTAYPCVLKPLRLSASRGVIRADNPEQLVAAARRIARILQEGVEPCDVDTQFLAEDFVPGPEVALEGLMVDGRLEVLALFDKPDPLDGPFFEETIYVTPSRLPESAQRALAACAERAALALGIARGPVHVELRWNDKGPWLIELAARPIGGRCSAALRFGVDATPMSLEALHLHYALGMPAMHAEREPGAAAVMMIPTPVAGTLKEVAGQEAARAVRCVDDVVITAHPGQELVPLPEGSRYLGFIFARAGTPAEAEAAVREAHRKLEIRLA